MKKIVFSVMVVAFSLAMASTSFAKKKKGYEEAVSYTHLTLPTNREV